MPGHVTGTAVSPVQALQGFGKGWGWGRALLSAGSSGAALPFGPGLAKSGAAALPKMVKGSPAPLAAAQRCS